jgi:hypothetical protein
MHPAQHRLFGVPGLGEGDHVVDVELGRVGDLLFEALAGQPCTQTGSKLADAALRDRDGVRCTSHF